MSLGTQARRITEAVRTHRRGVGRHFSVFSHTAHAERLALYDIAASLPAGARALEIGSHIGSSALFIGAGMKRSGGAELLCVDTWMNQTMPDGEADTFNTFQTNTREYESLIIPIRKLSGDLTAEDIGSPLDFAFIDGDHSEDAVREDFLLLEPHMKPGSVIAFHDVAPYFPGVNLVLGEALASGRWQMAGFAVSLGWIRRNAAPLA